MDIAGARRGEACWGVVDEDFVGVELVRLV